jgi:hypothetical protein
VAAAVVVPPLGIVAVIVALNALLGGGEAVPFSRYPMLCSAPDERSSALRFEVAGTPTR